MEKLPPWKPGLSPEAPGELPFPEEVGDWLAGERIPFIRTSLPGCPFPVLGLKNRREETIRLALFTPARWQEIPAEIQPFFTQRLILQHTTAHARLIVLWTDYWRRHTVLMKARILAALGRTFTIPARLTQVRRIDKPTADHFLSRHHMQGSPAARYRYGLFLPAKYFRILPESTVPANDPELLVAVASYGAVRHFDRGGVRHRSAELIRYASIMGSTVAGGIDKLLTAYARQHSPDDIMTYTDLEWSAGASFEKLGFHAERLTPPLAFFIDPQSSQRYSEKKIDLHQRKDTENILLKIYNAGNTKYVKTLSERRNDRVMSLPEDTVLPAGKPSSGNYPLIFILGPTASGKTSLAVALGQSLGAEIISVDSRQVFRRLDIGSGKDLESYMQPPAPVPYHLIDIREPGEQYNVYEFQKDFHRVLQDILSRGRTAIACGGSGLYFGALFHRYRFGNEDYIPPGLPPYLVIGLNPPPDVRRRSISERLRERLGHGLIEEVRMLLDDGIPPEALLRLGLEYKHLTEYLTGKYSYEEMTGLLETAIHRYAKRQMTFFRKLERAGVRIHWLPSGISAANRLEAIHTLLKKS